MTWATKRNGLILGGILIAAAGIGFAVATEADDRPDPAAGRKIAERLCARCHAIGPEGESPFAGASPFRTFKEKWPLENLEESLAEGIVVGHEAMPEFQLTPEQIGDLIAYLESL